MSANEGEQSLCAALADNIPGCMALVIKNDSREIVAANRLARERSMTPGLICHEAYGGRSDPCPFCRAPLLWETGRLQRVEAEYGGGWNEHVWASALNGTYVHYIFDITERKRTEENLRLLEFAIDHASDMVSRVDVDGRFAHVSESMCARLGYSREQLLARPVWEVDIMAPGGPAGWPDLWAQLKTERAVTFESVLRTKSGQVFPVEVATTLIEHEGKEYSLGILRDVSERKRAERDQQITSHGIDHACLGLVRLDRKGRVREVNGYMCRLLGYSREELLRLTAFDFTVGLKAESWPRRWAEMKKLGPVTFEKDYRTKDGAIIPVEISSTLVEFEGEELTHGFIRDISDRKAAAEALQQRDDQLRQAQKMEAMGRLAGGIAHDFNNLLMAIIGYSDLLLGDESLTGLPAVDDIREIKHTAERAAGLTQQILAFSRRQKLDPELASINTLIEETVPLLSRILGEDIELSVSLDPDLGLTEIDRHQFSQVIMNLAVNARDAMPTGGRLSIRTVNVLLDEDSVAHDRDANPGPYVCMSVSDTGTGMDPEAIPLIFEPFYTTKLPGKGTGLGLPTAHGVIKQSGGTISVESTLGKGTTFRVYLPRVDGERAGPGSQHSGDGQGQLSLPVSKRILVVEDEDSVRALMERLLGSAGYTVLAAADARQGLALLESQKPPVDLVISDIVLPGGMNGIEMVEVARRARPGLPVVLMSGYARDAQLETGSDPAAPAFLKKPFTADELHAKIREVLGGG